MSDDAPKGSSDFLRLYVIVMALMAVVLGVLLWKLNGNRKAFEQANATSRTFFGSADKAQDPAATLTTVTDLGVGVQKYLATYREATVKINDAGPAIPIQKIKDRAGAMGLQISTIGGDQTSRNSAKRYEEVSVTVTFDATDLERLVKFMYNLEADSTRFRILDVRWELRPDKENPYEPGVPGKFGHQINRPQVKIGFRRPITGPAR